MLVKKMMVMAIVATMAASMVGCGEIGSAGETTPVITTTATEPTATGPAVSESTVSEAAATGAKSFPQAGQTGGYSYEITENCGYFQKSKEQGYWIDALEEPDSPLYIFINSGKNLLDKQKAVVTDMTINGTSVEVTVDFVSLSEVEAQEFENPSKTCITILHGAEHLRKVTVKTVDGTEVKFLND